MASEICWASSCYSVMLAINPSAFPMSLRTGHTTKESEGTLSSASPPQSTNHHWLSHFTRQNPSIIWPHIGFYTFFPKEALKKESCLLRIHWPAKGSSMKKARFLVIKGIWEARKGRAMEAIINHISIVCTGLPRPHILVRALNTVNF